MFFCRWFWCYVVVCDVAKRGQATVSSGDEGSLRELLEALNVVVAKRPQLLLEGQGLDVVGNGVLSLAASPALEVRYKKKIMFRSKKKVFSKKTAFMKKKNSEILLIVVVVIGGLWLLSPMRFL